MATLTILGAAHGVTGSCYLLETAHSRVLLECGLVQGRRADERANAEPFAFDVATLDAVILSHGHLDHSGRLPRLVGAGFAGPVHMSEPTVELLEVLLRDAASLARRDAEWENKRLRRAGKPEIAPLFTADDVASTLSLCEGLAYGERHPITADVAIRFRDAGHILGSTIVEVFVDEADGERHLVFSGDLGNGEMALLRPPESLNAADLVLMESTYGNRDHRPMAETLEEFEAILAKALENGGNILIPSFAVGRAQEILFRLGELYQRGKLRHQRVYLDSPMAIAATEVYHRWQSVFAEDDRATLGKGRGASLHTLLPTLRYASSTEESIALNRIESGAIIIAGSGMCNGGRIRHHLKHNLWKRDAHVVIVGYQANGTPGRRLVDGAHHLVIHGEEIAVNATVHTLGGFSAHAGRSELLDWAAHFRAASPRLCLIHGDPEAKLALRQALARRGMTAEIPAHGDVLSF